MGFNLEVFFEELLEVIDNKASNDYEKCDKLDELIRAAHKYAKECGHVA